MTSLGKATVEAPANLALVKYWGARNVDEGLPLNPSLSLTLSRCTTVTTVEALEGVEKEGTGIEDEVLRLEGGAGGETGGEALRPAPDDFAGPIRRHLERLRSWDGRPVRFRVATHTHFPVGAGLASSASGFAALTLAAAGALGRDPGLDVLSVLARKSGSGSAARSIHGGFVVWPGGSGAEGVGEARGEFDPEAPARPILPPGHWDLRNLIALVDPSPKKVSSREGHRRAETSPLFGPRLEGLPRRFGRIRQALELRSFERLAPLVEAEAVELHAVAMTSRPPIFYWRPGTVEVMEAVRSMREEGLPVCFTIDAGPNVHVLCPREAEEEAACRLASLPSVQEVLSDGVGSGPAARGDHLF